MVNGLSLGVSIVCIVHVCVGGGYIHLANLNIV